MSEQWNLRDGIIEGLVEIPNFSCIRIGGWQCIIMHEVSVWLCLNNRVGAFSQSL